MIFSEVCKFDFYGLGFRMNFSHKNLLYSLILQNF